MGDKSAGQGGRVAPPPHLRDADAPDGRGRGRGGAAQGGEDPAGQHGADPQPARELVEPAVDGLVKIGRGPRGRDGGREEDEQRNGQQGEAVHGPEENMGHGGQESGVEDGDVEQRHPG